MVYKVDLDTQADALKSVAAADACADKINGPGPSVGKRVSDKVLAGLGLAFFAPFIAIVALLILLTDGRPVFYGHRRVGFGGREFGCLKFRTMCKDADQRLADHLKADPDARKEWDEQRKLTNDPRVTPVGAFLRKTSLDELPQLFNILAGDMSVVGPRPVVQDEAQYYGNRFTAYKSVRPGLTGLWQVSGRSDTGYAERVDLDEHYVAHQSIWMDARIIAQTVVVVVNGKGAR